MQFNKFIFKAVVPFLGFFVLISCGVSQKQPELTEDQLAAAMGKGDLLFILGLCEEITEKPECTMFDLCELVGIYENGRCDSYDFCPEDPECQKEKLFPSQEECLELGFEAIQCMDGSVGPLDKPIDSKSPGECAQSEEIFAKWQTCCKAPEIEMHEICFKVEEVCREVEVEIGDRFENCYSNSMEKCEEQIKANPPQFAVACCDRSKSLEDYGFCGLWQDPTVDPVCKDLNEKAQECMSESEEKISSWTCVLSDSESLAQAYACCDNRELEELCDPVERACTAVDNEAYYDPGAPDSDLDGYCEDNPDVKLCKLAKSCLFI